MTIWNPLRNPKLRCYLLFVAGLLVACYAPETIREHSADSDIPVGDRMTKAMSVDDKYISWQEHLIDDKDNGGVDISGSDGLSIGDLDKDGHTDIVSVHEADTEYDGQARGLIRIAFGSDDPQSWELVTLAEGAEAGAAEDVAIADVNNDGYLDIVGACELSHLIYFENPKTNIRSSKWDRLIPEISKNRGSFIRVFAADLNNDGSVEIIAANKGDQLSDGLQILDPDKILHKEISFFQIDGNPLENSSWSEHVLARVAVPINSRPVDIDKDGDMDIIGGSRGEKRIMLFENTGNKDLEFITHPISTKGTSLSKEDFPAVAGNTAVITGFNMEFLDLNEDDRLDIILSEAAKSLVWLEQPTDWKQDWQLHLIDRYGPDELVGIVAADINGDGYADLMTGGYSRGDRRTDGDVSINEPLGRLVWFQNPGSALGNWTRHDISRRKRGMFDKFVALDLDGDNDLDFVSTRGNSYPYDGVFWLEQVRTEKPVAAFKRARAVESDEVILPE